MDQRRDPTNADSAGSTRGDDAARLRFKGIIEKDDGDTEAAPRAFRAPDAAPYRGPERRRRPSVNWTSMARQMLLVTRFIALFWIFAVFVGWPVGDRLAYVQNTGSGAGWTIWHAVSFEGFLLAIVASFLTLLLGYIVSRLLHTVNAAETIASAAQQLVAPDANAADNVRHVGAAIRGQMDSLNVGLDAALTRLASVEAMIRQHVEAIETAGHSMERKASGAVARIADERSRLIDLTENLNTQADAFAAAIAAKAQASIESLHSADDLSGRAQAHLEDRLARLEAAAQSALQSFNALGAALDQADGTVKDATQRIESSTAENRRTLEAVSRAAEAAAESAGRNAANVGAAAQRAAESARKAADASIEASARESDRAARAAVEATEREAGRIAEAAEKALDAVKRSTQGAIAAAVEDAAKTTGAADRIAEAARRAAETAAKASEDVTRASDAARRSAEEALATRERHAEQAETRNKALGEARAALEAENARLESLIAEQRSRADRLADAIASQTERLSKLAEAQLREQEAAARLAEAQAQMQARASEDQRRAEEARLAEDARRRKEAEESRRAEEARLAAEREAKAAEARAADDERRRAEDETRRAAESRKVEARKPNAQPGVLDLSEASRAKPAAKNDDGRNRLDLMAEDIARPRRDGQDGQGRRDKRSVSWREILDATDEAEPLDLAAASVTPPQSPAVANGDASKALRIIAELQSFTLDLEARLYGDPPLALRERFERGDRNVFANRLLRLNETDVKRRIRVETSRDKAFERDLHAFLQGFERLLEDATTSETADEDLEEYLSSPLGRVYLLIGATVGYFA